ncbi:filamentous hemagglutinin N-terminal domain-containing protein [Iodobacter arcticus]|uniref:Filamentous hemagglutinin N-terminal domain-containing protein n=1 Tax=Iodobacter arcticus TaxID=590593 RepID=A0ABW2R6I3_9NEIS
MKPQFPLHPLVLAIASTLPLLMGVPAYANPENARIIHGSADIQQVGKMLTIKNTPNAIIEWQKFNIANDEATRFQQESAKSIVLNRVSGIDPSQILGQLSSNGRVFLINKNGLLVGKDARIDTAGFVASTLDIKNDDFLNGRYRFDGHGGKIAVEGVIRSQNGDVFLISPDIKNSGLIEASNGNVVLAAGKSVEIVSLSLEGLRFTLQAPSDSVINLGQIKGDAVGLFAGTLKHSGEIRAVRAEQIGGKVLLRASDQIETSAGSQITANGAVGGQVTLDASPTGILLASGQISATGLKGGDVQLLGKHVGLLDHAIVDASGQNAGGSILLGGDYQGGNPLVSNSEASYTSAESTLRADAITEGNGGKVIVWADNISRVNGEISARGGALSGDGGLVETSGKKHLDFNARVDTSAPAGKAGTLLLDPNGISIISACPSPGPSPCPPTPTESGGIFSNTNASAESYLLTTAISTALLSNNVTVQSEGIITVSTNYSYTSNNSLTLHAQYPSPSPTPAIDMGSYAITNSGTGDIILKADNEKINSGAISTQGNITFEAYALELNGAITTGTDKKTLIKAKSSLKLGGSIDDDSSSSMGLKTSELAKISGKNLEFRSEDSVSIQAEVDRSGKNLSIYGKTGISQTTLSPSPSYGYIKADHLTVSTLTPAPSGSISPIDLGLALNYINKISVKTEGTLKLKNSNALEIAAFSDSSTSSSSSEMGDNSWIKNEGNISQSAPISIKKRISDPPSPAFEPGELLLLVESGSINLNNSSNSIGKVTAKTVASGAGILIKNNADLKFSAVSDHPAINQSGIITNNGNISIENSGSIDFDGLEINAGTGNADLITTAASKTITIPSSGNAGKITATNINLQADSIALTSGSNVATLLASGGTINISPTSSAIATQLGGSRSGFGISQSEFNNMTANSIKIGNSSHQLGTVNLATIDLSTGSSTPILEVYSNAAVSQTGALKVKGFAARGSSITLNNSGNLFNDGVALTASGDIDLDYTGNLAIGLSGYADGLASSNDISVRASNNLTINNLIAAKNLSLTATAGAINQSVGIIQASKLTAASATALNLGLDNKIDTLSARNTTGDIKIKNNKILNVSSLKSSGNIDLNSTGDITLDGELSTANTATLKSNNISQASSSVITVGTLSIAASGTVTLDKENMIDKAAINSKNINLNNNKAITLDIINSNNGDIKITNKGDITLNDTLTANTATITASQGNINLASSINTKTSTLNSATGSVNESSKGSINSNNLSITAAKGISLDQSNKIDIASLKTSQGNIVLNNTKILSLAESSADQFKLNNTEGLVLTGNLSANQIDLTANTMSDSANAKLSGNAKLTATGDIVLNNSVQNIGTLSASSTAGDLLLKNNDTILLKEIKARRVDISTAGKITVDGPLSSTDAARLQSASGISINNSINSKNLNLTTDQLNMGEKGQIDTTDFFYTPSTTDTVKVSLGGNTRINSGLELSQSDFDRIKASRIIIGDAKGNKVGDISIKGFNIANSDLFINSAGALSQTTGGTITTKLLNAQASSISLGEANTVDTFVPNSNGDIIFANTKTLALGPIKTAGLLRIDTQGNLGLNDGISAKDISLKASGGEISSLANGALNAETLIASASKGIKLDNANTINQASLISSEGDISFSNTKSLTLGKTNSSGNIQIRAAGNLNINENISSNTISLNSDGKLISSAIITSKQLNAKAATGITLDKANSLDQVKLISDSGNIILLNSKELILDTTSTNGDIQIGSNGNLLIKDSLTGNLVQFKIANGSLNEAGGAKISANKLNVDAELGINLQENANTIDFATLNSKGDITLNNSKSLALSGANSAGVINVNTLGTLIINNQVQGTAVNLKANELLDTTNSQINTEKLQLDGKTQITLDKGNHKISQLSANSDGSLTLNNNVDLALQGISTKGNVLIDNQGTLTVSAPLSADDTSLISNGALRVNGALKSTGTIRLSSRDTGKNDDNIIQNTALIAAGDIKINANDSYIQNADLIAGATTAQLNNQGARQGAQPGVSGTTGEISVDATVIQVAPGVKAVSANGGAITYGSSRTVSNNITADQIKTSGLVNKTGKNPDGGLISKLPINATEEQAKQLVKVIVLQKQDQQIHFQLIGTGQLPFEAQKPEEIEPPKETIRVAGEDDANCP